MEGSTRVDYEFKSYIKDDVIWQGMDYTTWRWIVMEEEEEELSYSHHGDLPITTTSMACSLCLHHAGSSLTTKNTGRVNLLVDKH